MVKMFHLYGVMEDIEGPDTAGDDVRGLGEALGSFRIFFSKSDNRIYGKEYGLWGAVLDSRTPQTNFYWIQKVSIPIYLIHGTKWCIQKNPNFTHLKNGHFFGTP